MAQKQEIMPGIFMTAQQQAAPASPFSPYFEYKLENTRAAPAHWASRSLSTLAGYVETRAMNGRCLPVGTTAICVVGPGDAKRAAVVRAAHTEESVSAFSVACGIGVKG